MITSRFHRAREIPDLVTPACAAYIPRINELSNFGLSPSSDEFSEQFVCEILLSRIVESFNYYLTELLSHVFSKTPDMLKGDANFTAKEIIEAGDYPSLVKIIVDKTIINIAYKSVRDINSTLERKYGIPLALDEDDLKAITVAVEVRNLIAHNDCCTNEQFLRKTSHILSPPDVFDCKIRMDYGKRVALTNSWVWEVKNRFDDLVYNFDERASQKFGLEREYSQLSVVDR